nr:MAG TPA: hypothetical protein [Caudoviricetes sp.]
MSFCYPLLPCGMGSVSVGEVYPFTAQVHYCSACTPQLLSHLGPPPAITRSRDAAAPP